MNPRCGKEVSKFILMAFQCMSKDGTNALVLTTRNALHRKELTKEIYEIIFNELNFDGHKAYINENIIKFPNGSKIYIRNTDEEEKIRGINCDYHTYGV